MHILETIVDEYQVELTNFYYKNIYEWNLVMDYLRQGIQKKNINFLSSEGSWGEKKC